MGAQGRPRWLRQFETSTVGVITSRQRFGRSLSVQRPCGWRLEIGRHRSCSAIARLCQRKRATLARFLLLSGVEVQILSPSLDLIASLSIQLLRSLSLSRIRENAEYRPTSNRFAQPGEKLAFSVSGRSDLNGSPSRFQPPDPILACLSDVGTLLLARPERLFCD